MGAVADGVRADLRASLSPVPVYPLQVYGTPPAKYVQVYDGSETPGRPAIETERAALLYVHLYAEREDEVDAMYESIAWLHGHDIAASGPLRRLVYHFNRAFKGQDPDLAMHVQAIFDVDYYRVEVVPP